MRSNKRNFKMICGKRKRIIPLVLIIILSLFWQSCTKTDIPVMEDADYNIDMTQSAWKPSAKADTLTVLFNIRDKEGKRVVISELYDNDNIDIEITEVGGDAKTAKGENKKGWFIEKPIIKEGGMNIVSNNHVFLFLIDRTNIDQKELDIIKNAINESLKPLSNILVYLSFVDNYENIELVTKETFESMITQSNFMFEPKGKIEEKIILQALKNQFEMLEKKYDNTNTLCNLFLFTDAGSNPEPAYIDWPTEVQKKYENKNCNIKISVFRYKNDKNSEKKREIIDMFLDTYTNLHFDRTKNGKFYPVENASKVAEAIKEHIENEVGDNYQLTWIRTYDKDYTGDSLHLYIKIKLKSGITLASKIPKSYTIGTPPTPVKMYVFNRYLILSAFFSLVLLLTLYYAIIKILIPYIQSKREKFEKKHVIEYEPKEGVAEKLCPYCERLFERGQRVVVKCDHMMHYDEECWIKNGHKCYEYGSTCWSGTQQHFDIKYAFEPNKGPHFRKWAFWGALCGWITAGFNYCVFNGLSWGDFSKNLVEKVSRTFNITLEYKQKFADGKFIDDTDKITDSLLKGFDTKISGFLFIGILLGFTLTFLFTWLNENRSKKEGIVLLKIIGRSFIGALAGFMAFFIGSIVCVLFGPDGATAHLGIDGITWSLFFVAIALCLSVNSSIKIKDAIIGSAFACLACFLFLSLFGILSPFGMFISFILCCAGIGISIAVKHKMGQKHLLRVSNKNDSRIVYISKWLSGKNRVSIGKSVDNNIQIYWEDEDEKIEDFQAELYIDENDKKLRVKPLEAGMTIYNNNTTGIPNHPYPLEYGQYFKIGKTTYTYIDNSENN